MNQVMKESGKMTRQRDKESFIGLVEIDTKEGEWKNGEREG